MRQVNELEEGQDGHSDKRTTKMEIEPLKIKTLADLIGVCREKGYQVYNDKPNIPEADRIRTEALGRQSIYTSKKHHTDDRNPNLLGRFGSLNPGDKSLKACADRRSVMTDVDSNNVASRMTSAWSSYYSRSRATSRLSKQTECDDLADAEEILQQRMRRWSKRRREKRPGALVDLMIQMTLQKDNEIATGANSDTRIVSPVTTGNTVPKNVTKKPDKVRANGDKSKLNKTKGSNPISGASTVVSKGGTAQNNNKNIMESLKHPKANNANNKKGKPTPKSVENETKKMSLTASKEKVQNSGSQNHSPDNQIKSNQNSKFAQSNTNIKTVDKKKTVQDHSSTEKENSDGTVETKTQIMISSSKDRETDIKESPQMKTGISASNDSRKELKGENKQKSSNVALNLKDETGEEAAAVSGQHSENSVRDDIISEMVEDPEKTTTNASYENPKQSGTLLTSENDNVKHVKESLQNPKANNANNKKGKPIPKSVENETKKMSLTASKEKVQNSGSKNHAPDNQIKANQNSNFAQSNTNIKTVDKKKTVQDHSSTEKGNSDGTVETKTQITISSSKNKKTDTKKSPQMESGISASNDSEKELKEKYKQKSGNAALNSKDDTGEVAAAVSGQHSENSVRDDNISEMVEDPDKTTTNASYENPKQSGTLLTSESDNVKHVKESLQNPKANNAKNKKGKPIPKSKSVENETKKMSVTASKEKVQNSGSQNHAPDNQIKANQNSKFAQSNTNIKTVDKKKTVQDHSSTEKENSDGTVETKTQITISSSKNKKTDTKKSPQMESGISASNDSEKGLKGENKQKSGNAALNSKDDTGEVAAAVSGQHSENSVRDDNISEMVENPEKTTTNASCENPKQSGTLVTNENDDVKHVNNFHSDSSVEQATENNDEKVLDELRIKDGNSTLVLYKVKEHSLLNLGKSSKDVTWTQEKDSKITAVTVNSSDSVGAKTEETNESKENSETKTKSDETKSTECSPSKKDKLNSKANRKSETLSKKARLILILEQVKQTNEECSDLHTETINLFEEARKSFRNLDNFDEPEKEEINDKAEPEDEYDTEPEEDQTPEPDEVLEPKPELPPKKKEQCFIYQDPTLDTTRLPVDNVYIVEAKRIFPFIDLMDNKIGARKRTGKYTVKHVNSRYADIFTPKNDTKVPETYPGNNKQVKFKLRRVGSVPSNFASSLRRVGSVPSNFAASLNEVTESKADSKKEHRSTMKLTTVSSVKQEFLIASSNKIGKERKHKTVVQNEKHNKVLKQAYNFSDETDRIFSNGNKTSKNIISKQNNVRCRSQISKLNSYPKFEFKTNNTCKSASFTNRVKPNKDDASPNGKEDISSYQSAADRTSREKLPNVVPNSEKSRVKSGKSDTSLSAAVEIVHSRTGFYKGMLSNGETNVPRGHRVHKLFKEIQRIRRQVTSYPGPASSVDEPGNFLDIDRGSGFLFADYSEPGENVTNQKTNTDLNKFLYGDDGVYSKDKSTHSNYRRRAKALDSLKQKM